MVNRLQCLKYPLPFNILTATVQGVVMLPGNSKASALATKPNAPSPAKSFTKIDSLGTSHFSSSGSSNISEMYSHKMYDLDHLNGFKG